MKKFLTFILVLAMVLSVSSFAMAETCTEPCTHGAAIGDEHYATLEDALKVATGAESVTITLLKDASINVSDAYIKLGGASTPSITIDGQGAYDLLLTTTYWSRLDMANSSGKLILKNIPEMTSSQTSGTWNSYDVTFRCDVEIENVGFKKAVAVEKDAKLTNVTIEETNDYYALWIEANGQTVELNNVTINSDGRGIKIDDQYVDSPAKVSLIVTGGSVESAKKAAIMVKSAAGAEVSIDNLDISKVVADNEAAVWVDEDAAGTVNDVVTNASKKVEGKEVVIPPYGKVEGDTVSTPVARIGTTPYYTLQDALKALTDGDTLTLLDDVTITEDWDCRNYGSTGDGATFNFPVTINGNGHTLKFTGKISDGHNHLAVFRFEAGGNANISNLTIDMSEAQSVFQNRFSAISTKANLTVDNCTFIGNTSATNATAIIFGETNVKPADIGDTVISITRSAFKDWGRGVSDNKNGTDVKSVAISGNEFNNADVIVSASESAEFTGNTVNNSRVNIKTYTENNELDIVNNDNTIDGQDAVVDETGELVPAPSAPPSSEPTTKPSTGSGISVKYNGGNSFSTSKSAVPTSVEIDGVPVTFNGTGSSFTVSGIPAGAKWVTVRWNSTSVTTNFTPNGAYFAEVGIPKTGDMSFWAAIAQFLGF